MSRNPARLTSVTIPSETRAPPSLLIFTGITAGNLSLLRMSDSIISSGYLSIVELISGKNPMASVEKPEYFPFDTVLATTVAPVFR